MLIGLGKHEGAKIYHKGILTISFSRKFSRRLCRTSVGRLPRFVAAMAILENAKTKLHCWKLFALRTSERVNRSCSNWPINGCHGFPLTTSIF